MLNLKLLYLTLTPLRLPLDQQVGHQTLIIAMHTLLVTRRLVILAMFLRRFHLHLDQGTIRILLLVVVCVPFSEHFWVFPEMCLLHVGARPPADYGGGPDRRRY
jgi:hypothetical protein